MFLRIAVSVCFQRSAQSNPEESNLATFVLNVTNPLSTDFTVRVNTVDGTAIGKRQLIFNFGVIIILQEEVLIMILGHTLSHSLLDRPVLLLLFQ